MADYHWRGWQGKIPSNAVKAGLDKDGGNIYVGRAFHSGDVLPAKVLANHRIAYVSYNGKEHSKKEFELLCKEQATTIWKECSGGQVPPGAVQGGQTSKGERLYVGRVFYNGTLTLGKIHPSHGVCYIPYDGSELNFSSYEVLMLQ